mmetsp:Transcript_15140/g.43925  ORF Transcript_15140/g.43925 Transcript_15140/m.43925 type:complete len:243 (-) Transcript_15140:185-913(-)
MAAVMHDNPQENDRIRMNNISVSHKTRQPSRSNASKHKPECNVNPYLAGQSSPLSLVNVFHRVQTEPVIFFWVLACLFTKIDLVAILLHHICKIKRIGDEPGPPTDRHQGEHINNDIYPLCIFTSGNSENRLQQRRIQVGHEHLLKQDGVIQGMNVHGVRATQLAHATSQGKPEKGEDGQEGADVGRLLANFGRLEEIFDLLHVILDRIFDRLLDFLGAVEQTHVLYSTVRAQRAAEVKLYQ